MPKSKDSTQKSKSKSIKYNFTLKNIDISKIDRIYGIELKSNIELGDNKLPINITKLNEISNIKEKATFSYLDEAKKSHKCSISMINSINKEFFPKSTNIHCFWCKHPFNTQPLGCPIKYIPSQLVKNYYSEITKDNYKIRENISKNKREKFEQNQLIDIVKKEYYLVDGMFCSFNCCLAFIRENNTNPMYALSKNLLARIYKDIFNNNDFNVECAPSWRLLEAYGGHMSIEEFRDQFYKVEYIPVSGDFIWDFKSIGILYEEKVKF